MYKLYLHVSPSGKKYYGITCRDVKARWNNGNGYKKHPHFYNAICKYGWNNFEHTVLFDDLSKEEACLLEQCYIALYDTTNPECGYNCTSGGEHFEHSELTKARMKANNTRPNLGKHFTNEHRNKMSNTASRPVLCIEYDTIFPSAIDAGYFFGDTKKSRGKLINDCLNDKSPSKTAYNCHWRVATEDDLHDPYYDVIKRDYDIIY